ncbi:MAG: tail fiber domain-containing protein [Patescibacteria group bacterium]|nr:tail fiber domain-containing protein [Patescibacteria group bacterium]
MKKLVILSFSVLLLTLSVFVVNAATTFQGPPAGCTSAEDPNCNLDGVIWNRSTSDPAQNASFHISGNSRTDGSARVGNGLRVDSNGASIMGDVLVSGKTNAGNGTIEMWANGDLKMIDGKALRIDQDYSSSTLYIANYGADDHPVNVNIQGTISVAKDQISTWGGTPNVSAPQFCLNGNCITSWPTTGGGGTVTSVGSGNGLTGGPITSSGSLNVGAGTGISVAADTVGLDTTYTDGRYVNTTGDTMSGELSITRNIADGNALTVTNNINTGSIHYAARFYGPNSNGYGVVGEGGSTGVSGYGATGVYGSGSTYGVNGTASAGAGFGGYFRNNTGTMQAWLGSASYALQTSGASYLGGNLNISGTTYINSGQSLCFGTTDCRSSWPAAGGSGDITGVTAGTGLSGGGMSGDVTLNITGAYALPQGCTGGYVPKWNTATTAWVCSPDINTDSGGDITGVTAGTGLTGGGATGNVTLGLAPCPNAQVYKSNGTSMTCQADSTGSTPPAGANQQIQFNNSGSFGADADFTWDSTNNRMGIRSTTPVNSIDIGYGGGISTRNNFNYVANTLDNGGLLVQGITSGGTVYGQAYLGSGSTEAAYFSRSRTYDTNNLIQVAIARKIGSTSQWNGIYTNGPADSNYTAAWFSDYNGTRDVKLVTGSYSIEAKQHVLINGQLYIDNTTDASLTNASGALVIGPKTGTNMVFDGNEIQARNNGTASTMYLNNDGGSIRMGGSGHNIDVIVNGFYAHTSDARLKENVNKLKYGLEDIMKLRPITFEWRSDDTDKINIGFIAQDVQRILPEVVNKDPESQMLNLSDNQILPVLVNAVQEQQLQIEILEKRIEALETK